jgi:putative methyltransferase (TIGR04325 family)
MAINENSKVWEGIYATFAETEAKNAVFEEPIWLDKIRERARHQLLQASVSAAVSPAAVTSDYALPFVAALAAQRDKELHILDFGGGMGTGFIPLVNMLPHHQPINFVIVENGAVCNAGREFFGGDSRISFREDVPDAGGVDYDIVHCGSSLHYVDDWEGLLDKFTALYPEYLLFADLPAADNRSFVTAQMFHGQRIPVHFWNFSEFVDTVEARGFELAFQSRYRGYYLEKNASPPTSNFDAAHQLHYLCQLIFRRIENKSF